MVSKKEFLLIGLMASQLYAQDQSSFIGKCKNTATKATKKMVHTLSRKASRLGAGRRIGLCHEGPAVNMPALHAAVLTGDKQEVVKILAQQGTSIEVVDSRGLTALHWAAFMGFYDIARSLIEQGAKVDCIDNNDWTPLHYAAERGHYSLVTYLVDKAGAHKEAKTKLGATAWWIAEDRRILAFLDGEESETAKSTF